MSPLWHIFHTSALSHNILIAIAADLTVWETISNSNADNKQNILHCIACKPDLKQIQSTVYIYTWSCFLLTRGSAMMMRILRSARVVKLTNKLFRTYSPGLLSGSMLMGSMAGGPLSLCVPETGGTGGLIYPLPTGEAEMQKRHINFWAIQHGLTFTEHLNSSLHCQSKTGDQLLNQRNTQHINITSTVPQVKYTLSNCKKKSKIKSFILNLSGVYYTVHTQSFFFFLHGKTC